MDKPDADRAEAKRKQRTKRLNKHIELAANYLNGAGLAVLALGVFRYVLDPGIGLDAPSWPWTLGLVALSGAFHAAAQLLYLLLRQEE